MTRLLLVRHGQSEWNAAGRWQGQADPPLTPLGRAQAVAAARRVGAVDLVVTSDLLRAGETAGVIAAQLGVGPVVIEGDLRETGAGEWTGLTKAEIEAAWPGYLERRDRPPGFEDRAAFRSRVQAALGRIVEGYRGATVLVVTHGGVIYDVEDHLGAPFERVPNLGGRHLAHVEGAFLLGERVVLVEDDDLRTVPSQI
jgi:broad specificity phosphatase PhoE